LQKDENYLLIKKVRNRYKSAVNPVKHSAESLSEQERLPQTEQEIYLNLYLVRNDYKRSSGHLFEFLLNYQFVREVSFEERVTIFCKMISMFEDELDLTDDFLKFDKIEYAVVYPK
jgi:hypothetical protein